MSGRIKMEKKTICYKCKYFHNAEPCGYRNNIWYNHFCKASPLKTDIDPVTGRMSFVTENCLGKGAYTDRRFAYCRDINEGNCKKYEKK